MIPITIFVEGPADQKFLKDVIEYHFNTVLETGNDIRSTQGKDKLQINKSLFHQSSLKGKSNILIFDADSDINTRREELEKKKAELNIEFDLFLLPNDKEPGELETILEKIACSKSESIFSCFDQYQNCIESINPDYTKPDLKTKIFAYSEVVTGQGKEKERDYTNETVWNLKDDYLNSLINFLNPYFNGF